MNRLSAHIGYLYSELPFAERPAAAARDGFTAIEHPEPWSVSAAGPSRSDGTFSARACYPADEPQQLPLPRS